VANTHRQSAVASARRIPCASSVAVRKRIVSTSVSSRSRSVTECSSASAFSGRGSTRRGASDLLAKYDTAVTKNSADCAGATRGRGTAGSVHAANGDASATASRAHPMERCRAIERRSLVQA
jgi:hypothetical protein